MSSTKLFLFSFFLTVLAAGFASAQPKAPPLASLATLADSDSFSSAEDRFAIKLHRDLADKRPVPTGVTVAVYNWAYASLAVQVVTDKALLPLRTDADYDKYLAMGKEMAFGAVVPTDVTQTKISLGTVKGYELTMTLSDGSHAIGRSFMTDTKIYNVLTVFSAPKPGAQYDGETLARRTLDSFRILPEPDTKNQKAEAAAAVPETANLKKANGRPGAAAAVSNKTNAPSVGASKAATVAGAAAVPENPPEPYDKADAKTMAGLCVSLDTESGLIQLEMYPESAPESVRNFLNLTATGAFDTTTFSRVVPNFVIQGGSLSTSEKLTPQMARRSRRPVPDEPSSILHERGILSMARTDDPNSATTHFFILVTSAPSLDNKFAAFGRVIRGMDVVEAINKMPGAMEKPDKPVRIKKASVFACAPSN